MKPIKALLIASLFLVSCSKNDKKPLNIDKHFDLNQYFQNEVERLKKKNPEVRKEVAINDEKETKTLKITDWEKELEIFKAADINKADWTGLFKVSKSSLQESYTSENEKVFVKKLIVDKSTTDNRVEKITIHINRSNLIYNSIDTLLYVPDSLYTINKTQKIKLLAPRKYAIKGLF